MKCESCQVDINPKWAHAIANNICPMCGQSIMQEHLKNCLATLTIAMKDMAEQYPDQLNDWLLSNYNFIKTDSPNLKDYLPKEAIKELTKEVEQAKLQEKTMTTMKIKNGKGQIEEIEVETRKTQTPDKTQGFFERAEGQGIKKTPNKGGAETADSKSPSNITERTQYLKELAQQIKREGNKTGLQEDDLVSMIESDGNEPSVEDLASAIGSGDILHSAISSPSDGDEEVIPSVVMGMASRAAAKQGDTNQKDLDALANQHQKAQRSSWSGGFSR